MSITAIPPTTGEARPFKMGNLDAQLIDVTAYSGSTSGTLKATGIATLYHVILPSGMTQTTAPSYSGNTATLAFTVPAETIATAVIQDLTWSAAANRGAFPNGASVDYIDDEQSGTEYILFDEGQIVCHIQSGVTTATELKAVADATPGLSTYWTVAVSGTGSNAQSTDSGLFAGGVSGGAFGTALCLGRP